MRTLDIVKRFAPFLLTFALGLLIASFFVSVAAPNFSNFKRGKRHQNQQLKIENERLQNRINYLESRNAQLENNELNMNNDYDSTIYAAPAPKRVR